MNQRLNISLEDDVIAMAKQLEQLKRKTSFSALLSDLIVEEWERRNGPLSATNPGPSAVVAALNDAPAKAGSPSEHVADSVSKGTLHSHQPGNAKYPPTPRAKRRSS